MAVAAGLFGTGTLRGTGWRMWMPYAVFLVESAVLTAFMGASFGQLLARLAVVRFDGRALAWWQAVVRTLLKGAIIPAAVIGPDRRGLDDLALGTVVVTRR